MATLVGAHLGDGRQASTGVRSVDAVDGTARSDLKAMSPRVLIEGQLILRVCGLKSSATLSTTFVNT